MKSYYDDEKFSYLHYWRGRDYEHESEAVVLRTILNKKHFSKSADIGGGYGRLCKVLTNYCDEAILVEPSSKQLDFSKKYLDGTNVKTYQGTADKTGLKDHSLDLAIMVRVMHHLPNPIPTFTELYRIIKPEGILILEFANSLNFKSLLRSIFSGKPVSMAPVDLRKASNIKKNTIPFVNHHPKTVLKQLKTAGFEIQSKYSVSNFRHSIFKKVLPSKILMFLEKVSQSLLSNLYFGPSIFLVLKRLDKRTDL
jgi:ubiquinone/menaquinone biosynthesis C-methylase UbiE